MKQKREKWKDLLLLAADTPGALSNLHEMLGSEYYIEEASIGTNGLNKAKELIPDLIIIDITVLGMDDTRLCTALKNNDETDIIPVLVLYSAGSEDFIIKGFECGVEAYMIRPFTANLLKARIKNLVNKRRQLDNRIYLRNVPNAAHDFIGQVHDIMEENFANPLFTVEKLCSKLYLSRASMYRKIRAVTGESPQLFIRSYRLMRAAQLLKNKSGNVTEICFKVGFTSTAYFTKCFKERFQLSPKAFARSGV
ncbi:MAG TPA: DNA-binding response regulator [Candidatus Deferrimicrobium sp.]|nr:DNA-binding response regulator [Candidatus Kapabacteria bacterium]HLP59199.1 DNA-binding response regulator [Candidatus Deferrimicrobium sp.]